MSNQYMSPHQAIMYLKSNGGEEEKKIARTIESLLKLLSDSYSRCGVY